MKRNLLVMCVLMIACVGICLAQAPQAPTPGPEHKRLGVFVGKWNFDGEMKAGPWGPGGKTTGTQHVEWGPGGFSLVMHGDFQGVMGSGKSISILSYDPKQKVYTYDAWESMGNHESSKGAVKGKAWNWTGESYSMGPTPVKVRVNITELSPTSLSFKFETSPDGKAWTTVMEGKQTKSK